MPRRFYVTTPIYYVNDRPHLGHVFTTTLADVLARYHRLRGDEVFFLTGTDEHAAKVVDAAAARGLPTQEWADLNARTFQETFARLRIESDDFIRTSEERHTSRVSGYVRRLMDSGDVYAGQYEGWYDAGQEEYVAEGKARDQGFKSAIDGRPLVRKTERNYFFRLSAYQDALLACIEGRQLEILPGARRNEVLARIREGLNDVPMSRTGSPEWGIAVPGDPEQTIYVWIDALFNYLTCVDTDGRRGFWPPTVQLIGKDILWFHAVIWPALLLALREHGGMDWLELPRCIDVHSFWTSEGQKMSKSLGNSVGIEEIDQLVAQYGLDALRWFLVTRGPTGTNDSDFARSRFLEVYNSELANVLGNCTSRVIQMTHRWFGGALAEPGPQVPGAAELRAHVRESATRCQAAFAALEVSEAAQAALGIVRAVDGFIDRSRPFELAKRPEELPAVGTILATCADALRVASVLLWPLLPGRMEELWRRIGCGRYAEAMSGRGRGELSEWVLPDGIPAGTELARGEPLFPRFRPEDARDAEAGTARSPMAPSATEPSPAAPAPEGRSPTDPARARAAVEIAQFQALDLCVARVVEAGTVEGADRLLRLELEVGGGERRTVVSGIRESYGPAELVGTEVLYLSNLAPRKIRGVLSQGMVLAAHDAEGKAVLLRPDRGVPPGSCVT